MRWYIPVWRIGGESGIMAIKKAKLDYRPSVTKILPAEKLPVSSSHMEDLDRAIKQKVRQNEAERAASMEILGRYMVR